MSSQEPPLGRRRFLSRASMLGAGALGALGLGATGKGPLGAPAVSANPAGILGANERVVLGILGSGGRGRNVQRKMQEMGAEFAAVCDVYEPNLKEGLKVAGERAKGYVDYHEVLDRRDIDATLIGSPEHQHAPMLIDTVASGKDSYCEKPMSHSIEEGVRMVKAVRATDRIVQIGMQRRSSPTLHEARKLLGECGKVYHVKAYWNWLWSKPLSNAPLDGKLDWKRFLGPAPERELEPKLFRYWRYFWDYSGGNCTDQGTHLMDVVQWFMESGTPRTATCLGGVYEMKGSETPDIFSAVFEYEHFLASWTLNYTNTLDNGWNIQFLGTEGTLWLDNEGARLLQSKASGTTYNRTEKPHLVKEIARPLGDEEHIRNFLDCVRSRKEPNAPVEVGHSAVAGPHLANVAFRSGTRAQLDEAATKTST